tara:strand:- start:91 stop:297 length:207 start_codon:yes stop_codon:yes gene_type:complete
MDIPTVQIFLREIEKSIARKKEQLIYSVDSIEKLNYCRGQISSLEELLQVTRNLLNKEDIEYDDLGKT